MTYAEHVLAYWGYEEAYYMDFVKHRRTAYEIYLSRPKKRGATLLTIQRFMPLPTDRRNPGQSLKRIREVHAVMLEKLRNEKANGKRT